MSDINDTTGSRRISTPKLYPDIHRRQAADELGTSNLTGPLQANISSSPSRQVPTQTATPRVNVTRPKEKTLSHIFLKSKRPPMATPTPAPSTSNATNGTIEFDRTNNHSTTLESTNKIRPTSRPTEPKSSVPPRGYVPGPFRTQTVDPTDSRRWFSRSAMLNNKSGSADASKSTMPAAIIVPTSKPLYNSRIDPRPSINYKSMEGSRSPPRSKTYENEIRELFEGTIGLDDVEMNEPGDKSDKGGWVDGMTVRLMSHQMQGLHFLQRMEKKGIKLKTLEGFSINAKSATISTGCILADDMGLGKTIQALALVLRNTKLKDDDSMFTKSTLVVAPLALIRQWESEIREKCPSLRAHVHHGTSRKGLEAASLSNDIVITTYQVIVSEHSQHKQNPLLHQNESTVFDVRWWRVILDEAHTIKNRNSKSAQSCFALQTRSRICLTGTPIQNNADEIYSLVRFLRISPLDEYTIWNQKISQAITRGDGKVAVKRLRLLLSTIMLRRTKKVLAVNGINLPSRRIFHKVCTFNDAEKAFYDQLKLRTDLTFQKFLTADGTIGRNYTNVLCLLLRLRQGMQKFLH